MCEKYSIVYGTNESPRKFAKTFNHYPTRKEIMFFIKSVKTFFPWVKVAYLEDKDNVPVLWLI